MRYNKYVKAWLVTGCILLLFQIFIGGITRITGSGLSITKWEIITGTLPPLNKAEWENAFDMYKETPQYEKINASMDLSKFKFIYFWEYLHRLWARLMGLIFLFPLIFFIVKKWVDKALLKKLSYVIFWAIMAAVFGWIMVASGLVHRPWVNAYKLTLHLGIALTTLGFLLWTTFWVFDTGKHMVLNSRLSKLSSYFFIAICIQIFFGAIVSGMRASLYYPTWPDIGGHFIPDVLFSIDAWRIENIVNYDQSTFMPALIHVLHRNWGYFVYFFGIYFSIKMLRYPLPRQAYRSSVAIIVLLNIQVILGILTLLNSVGTIPVFYGILHQLIAIFILTLGLYNVYFFRKRHRIIQ